MGIASLVGATTGPISLVLLGVNLGPWAAPKPPTDSLSREECYAECSAVSVCPDEGGLNSTGAHDGGRTAASGRICLSAPAAS